MEDSTVKNSVSQHHLNEDEYLDGHRLALISEQHQTPVQ